MTRRDYVLIADALRKANERVQISEGGHHYTVGVKMAATELADALASKSRAFDKPRFMTAAGFAP